MQNKGLIKFFAILFGLVSIYQLSFTFIADGVEQEAKEFAKGDSAKEIEFLNKKKKEEVFLNYTYEDVAKRKINKGLDLEGGINVILEISVKDILLGLSNNSKNPSFLKALETAEKDKQGNESYLDAFFRAFEANNGGTRLSSPDLFANRNLEKVNTSMSDAEVQKVLREKVDESVNSAFEVLNKRIDKFGVVQPNIQRLGNSGRILVELPGAKDVNRINALLSQTAQLEFWMTYTANDVYPFLIKANDIVKAKLKGGADKPADSLAAKLASDDEKAKKDLKKEPILGKVIGGGGGPIVAKFNINDTATVGGYLRSPEVRAALPGNLRYAKFVWGKSEPIIDEKTKKETGESADLYALRGNKVDEAPLSGGVIIEARDDFDQMGRPSVSMQMNTTGARVWEQMTGEAHRTQGFIAIVLDNVVYSAPGVTTGAISGGSSIITGKFSVTETKDLANVLRAGKLPASAEIVQSQVVGPSLGQEAIDNGITSSIIGLLLVSLWMIVYYGRAGLYANIALAVNLLFLFGVMVNFGFVLTLPGIAGIVLTMGTAVDANIIIYERAKEELRSGKSLEDAIKTSFGWKGAMRSIIDANVTHILTGIVLVTFGTGPIKGFAITLLIGIVTSLYTSIFISRIFLDRDAARGRKLTFVTNMSKNWFTKFNFDFLRIKKWTYAFSAVVTIVCIVSLMTHGLNQSVEFVGGRTYQVRFDQNVSPDEVRDELIAVFGSAEVKKFGSDNQIKVVTKYGMDQTGNTLKLDEKITHMLYDAVKKHFVKDMGYENFVNIYDGKTAGILDSYKVTADRAKDIKTNAFWAVIGAMAIVFIYLFVSFRKWQYSLGAIAAVAHDVIFVLGLYSLLWKYMPFGMEIDQHFIAAILTVIGYSMNDTVIVFDRVREYLGGKTKGSFNHIVNQSINSTMSRTLNTSLSMIFVLVIMFIFGGESIRGFIFAMLIGIVVGTYSSLFIATPVLCDTIPDSEHKRIEEEHNKE
ncbi:MULTISPECIES: protein translocase subunit SecDF [unclassified Flavobacterium]|uniref:protein translocase subunit SecDF n=1 Tax=unclassified Flavobacterium TaxID=196869 RepID=UPI001F13D217|nr:MULTISPECIES: protein translocase subunit SecDF [unclassified Flavobacterium]UMY65520.1 protein translocase subunit SecDF [Flavobacterium sp. HJ-32-4]